MNRQEWLAYFDTHRDLIHGVYLTFKFPAEWERLLRIRETNNYDRMWGDMNKIWACLPDYPVGVQEIGLEEFATLITDIDEPY